MCLYELKRAELVLLWDKFDAIRAHLSSVCVDVVLLVTLFADLHSMSTASATPMTNSKFFVIRPSSHFSAEGTAVYHGRSRHLTESLCIKFDVCSKAFTTSVVRTSLQHLDAFASSFTDETGIGSLI